MLARWLAALCVAFLFAVAPPSVDAARAAPDYPAFTGLVVDDAHVLSPDDHAALTKKLEALQQKSGVQFAVATVPSLGGLEIEPYANALFRKWGIGQKGANNGLLLILAPNERKLRFEVGYGLEGTMTDAQSKLILHNSMVPKLKANDPAGALKAGVDDAIGVLTSKDASLPQIATQSADDTMSTGAAVAIFVCVLIFIVLVVVFIKRRSGLSWGSFIVSSALSSGSSSGGGSSGGDSFSGGGGGDSGGGGASDSY